MKKIKLDKEEQGILASFERGEWKAVKDSRQEIARHRKHARDTLRKDRRVNNGGIIRLGSLARRSRS